MLSYLVVVALLRAAVHLVILHQPLSQSDASQQVLDEALDSNFTARLLSGRRFQKLLDGYHLPGNKNETSEQLMKCTFQLPRKRI